MTSTRTIRRDDARLRVQGWDGSSLVAGTLGGADPLGFAAGDANLFRYVGNELTDLVDPSGLASKVPVSLPPIRPHNTIVLNGPPHHNGPVDNHEDGRYRPYFQSLGVPDGNMFDFNSLGGYYSCGFRAAIEKARQKTRAAGPPDIIIYVHGAPGVILFGENEKGAKEPISSRKQDEPAYLDFVRDLKLLLTDPTTGSPFGKLIILGCEVGSGAPGDAFLRQLEKDLGVPVYGASGGSTDIQGPPGFPTPTLVIDPGGSISRPR